MSCLWTCALERERRARERKSSRSGCPAHRCGKRKHSSEEHHGSLARVAKTSFTIQTRDCETVVDRTWNHAARAKKATREALGPDISLAADNEWLQIHTWIEAG